VGLLDSFLKDGSILGDLSRLASENPRILQAAVSLLRPREGTVGGRGGLSEVLASLQSSGLGDIASSWLSNGANRAIAPDQVSQALGSDTLRDFASAAGVDANEASSVLAGILPELVNQLSPEGQAPDEGSLEGLLGGLLARARS
jgi:uncharacterized protein YidB (DUF937 family)